MNNEKERCSNIDNRQCHLAMSLEEAKSRYINAKLEYDKELLKKRLKEKYGNPLDPYIICLLILGLMLIFSAIFGVT